MSASRLDFDPGQFHFSVDVRVRWADTDAGGIAYNGAYLTYFEVARVEYNRAQIAWKRGIGIDDPSVQDGLFDDPTMLFTLVSGTINWRAPARLDSRLRVATRVSAVGRTSFEQQYRITRVADGGLIALGTTTQVRVDARELTPIDLGTDLRDVLLGFERALATGVVAFPPRTA